MTHKTVRLSALPLLLPPAAVLAALVLRRPELASQAGRFALYFAVLLALPAMAIGRLLPLGERSWTECLFLGYAPAQVAAFLCIFAGARLGVPLLPAALPVLSALALTLIVHHNARRHAGAPLPAMPADSFWLTFGLLCLALLACAPSLFGHYFPTPGNPADIYHDNTGTAAFVWSAVRSLETGQPYMLPFVSGFSFPYHVIYHYLYGYAAFALGIPPMEQIVSLWPPLHWLMLAGCTVAALRRLAGFSALETGVALLALFFTEGYGFYSTPTLQFFNYYHTFFFGLPALLTLLAGLYGHLRGRPSNPVLLACCYFVAAGTKANLLPFIPIALAPVFVHRLWRRMAEKTDCLMAFSFSVFAALLFLTHYLNLGSGQARVKSIKFMSILMGSISNMAQMAAALGAFALVMLIASERDVVLRHKLRQAGQYLVFVATFCGIGAVFLKAVNYVGGDFYIFWQARLMLLLPFAAVTAHAFAWRTRVVAPLAAVVLAAGLALFVYPRLPIERSGGSWRPADAEAKNLDADEFAGLRWASTNLDHSRSMFTNKDHFLGSYLGTNIRIDLPDYLGFCGLQGDAWMVGFMPDKIKEATAPRYAWYKQFWTAKTPAEREAALANIKADYYFHCERQAKSDFAGVRGMREVYRNPSLTIYELTRGAAGQ